MTESRTRDRTENLEELKIDFYRSTLDIAKYIENEYANKPKQERQNRRNRLIAIIGVFIFFFLLAMGLFFSIYFSLRTEKRNAEFQEKVLAKDFTKKEEGKSYKFINWNTCCPKKIKRMSLCFMAQERDKICGKINDFLGNLKAFPEEVDNTEKAYLFSGPSGTGKTFLTKKIAEKLSEKLRVAYQIITPNDILNKYLGESERLIKEVFNEMVLRKDEFDVFIVVFDEINYILDKPSNDFSGSSNSLRNSMRAQFLSILDGSGEFDDVPFFVIGTTNSSLSRLDSAYMRRFKNKCLFKVLTNKVELDNVIESYIKNNDLKFEDGAKEYLISESKRLMGKGAGVLVGFLLGTKLDSRKNSKIISKENIDNALTTVEENTMIN